MSLLLSRLFGKQNASRGAAIRLPEEQPETHDERRACIIKCWTYYHGSDTATGRSQWTYLYERFDTLQKREIEDVENHIRICTDSLRRLLVNSWRGFEFDDERTGSGADGRALSRIARNRSAYGAPGRAARSR